MSSKYTHFLLTTCLPVVAVSLLMTSVPARAGFEFSPPEQQVQQQQTPSKGVPAPAVPVEGGEALPMPDQAPPVVPSVQKNEQKPVMQVKVFDEKTPEAKPVLTQDPPVKLSPVKPAVKEMAHKKTQIQPVPPVPQDIKSSAALPELPKDKSAENPVLKMPPVKVISKKEGLKINPYPVAQEQKAKKSGAVLLPDDKSKGIDSLKADDVMISAKDPVQQGEAITWDESKTYPVIDGFGSDIPLVLALSQIVPPDYAYSFHSGVNPGAVVSWEGGKPWNVVLAEVLAPLNVEMKIDGKVVSLSGHAAPVAPMGGKSEAIKVNTGAVVPDQVKGDHGAVVLEPLPPQSGLKESGDQAYNPVPVEIIEQDKKIHEAKIMDADTSKVSEKNPQDVLAEVEKIAQKKK